MDEKIEELLEDLTCEGEECGDCAIREDCKSPRVIQIIRDQEAEINRLQAALDAQKAIQKPLNKISKAYRQKAVWLEEYWNGMIVPAIVIDMGEYGTTMKPTAHLLTETNVKELEQGHYGRFWRCWAMKPSDEERAAAKWEG